MSTFVLEQEYEVASVPTEPPFACASCARMLPADGEYLRLGRNQTGVGYVWLCLSCQEIVLKAHRLMSLKVYEDRVAHDAAILAEKAAGLDAERVRLLGIEEREAAALEQERLAVERAELAEAEVPRLRQSVADLERERRELLVRAEQAEQGNPSVQMWEARRARFEAAVAERVGPAPEADGAAKPRRRVRRRARRKER